MLLLHVQILSNNAVATGVGVYWMFYSGASFEEAEAPEGFPGLKAHDSIEGFWYTPYIYCFSAQLSTQSISLSHTHPIRV